MKAIVSICIAFVVGFANVAAQVRFSLRAGANFNTVKQEKNSFDIKAGLKAGFHAGADVSMLVTQKIYLQSGLLFVSKGYANAGPIEMDATTYNLELPVNLVYKMSCGTGKLFFGAGAYACYGLGGTWKMPEYYGGNMNFRPELTGNLVFSNDVSWENYDRIAPGSELVFGRPLDLGANVLAGYEFSRKLSAQLHGQLGLTNLAPKVGGTTTNDKIRSTGFGVSIAYTF